MRVKMTKRRDGGAVLSCTRDDGSVTFQRHQGRNASFFPIHDLTHFAVETTLGHQRGFYGLLADGWEIGDFGSPWPRGPMPPETITSELIVGFLDAERASHTRWSAADLDDKAKLYFAERHVDARWTPLSDDDLARVRAAAAELISRWHSLADGDALDLEFPVSKGEH
jgi:hypothetical protein